MATFVLVHGAWHGGWCWERLARELTESGHDSIVMDLPVEDGSATFADYAGAVVAAAEGVGSDAVVVGHSLGGMVIPLVAAARPVAAMVFLCGVVPNFGGLPWDDAPRLDQPGVFDGTVTHADGSTSWPDVAAATHAFYHDCDADDAEWAFRRLRRQASGSLWAEAYPLTAWPAGRRIAIAGIDDRAVTIEYARAVCPARLGVDPVEIQGGHSPFLARPAELAGLLIRTALAG